MKNIGIIIRKFWSWMMKHKTIIIILLLAIGVLAFFIVRRVNQNAAAATSYQTAVIDLGTLTASVGATGNVRANQTAIITWQTSGRVGAVNVVIGDQVKAQDALASLDPASLSQNIILAQADLITAQRNLDKLLVSGTPSAQAYLSLVNSQLAYDNAKATLDNLLALNRGGSSEAVQNAQAQYTLAQNSLKQAQTAFDYVKDLPEDDPRRAQAYTALYNAQQAEARAKDNLDYFLLVPAGRDIEKARANFNLAETQLADAQREWERLKDGPDPTDILAAQARVDAARASVMMAQLTAPFAGTITDANPIPGDQVAPGTVGFRVDDLSRLLVDVQLSEVDINRVQVGQEVILTYDAVLGEEYHGKVAEIAQAGTVTQGVVNFTVTVELTDADLKIKPGMTAAVTITVEKLDNVLLVPNRAVRLLEGKRYVYILQGTEPKQVEIQLGASSDTVSEVIGGDLKAGDTIILNPSVFLTQTNSRPGFLRP